MGICKYCGKEFDKKSLGGHTARCKQNPNYEKTCLNDRKNLRKGNETAIKNKRKNIILVEYTQTCPKCGKSFTITCTESNIRKGKIKRYCSRKCANSRIHNKITKNKISRSLTEYFHDPNNKTKICNKTKNYNRKKTCNRKKICKVYKCKYCGKEFTKYDERNTSGVKYCSSECRTKWLKENAKWGGCRNGSGRGKSGWYKGIYCSSSWELAFVIYCLDNNISITRCKEKRSYVYNGKLHNYYPDFITSEGIIEIKGYITEQWLAKQKQNPDIIVLYKSDMEKYLNYVHDNYTNDLVTLYDNSKYKILTKTCWVHKDNINTIIKSELLDSYLNNGWIRGRICKLN